MDIYIKIGLGLFGLGFVLLMTYFIIKATRNTENKSQEESEEESENTYNTEVECKNCNSVYEFDVPKGQTLQQYLDETKEKCDDCGCLLTV